jgi:hypothetical protein
LKETDLENNMAIRVVLVALCGASLARAFVPYHPARRMLSAKTRHMSSSGASTDITMSDAFLRKKLEVLNHDAASLDEQIMEAELQAAAEEAEWGSQRKTLQTEFVNLQQRTQNEAKEATITARVSVSLFLFPSTGLRSRSFNEFTCSGREGAASGT